MDNHVRRKHVEKRHQIKGRTVAILALLMAAILVCAGWAYYQYGSKEVNISFDPNTGNTADVRTKTITAGKQRTVQDILQENNYEINNDKYTYSEDLTKQIKDVSSVSIKKKATGTITVGDSTKSYNSSGETVGDVLADTGVKLSEGDTVTPSKNSKVSVSTGSISVASAPAASTATGTSAAATATGTVSASASTGNTASSASAPASTATAASASALTTASAASSSNTAAASQTLDNSENISTATASQTGNSTENGKNSSNDGIMVQTSSADSATPTAAAPTTEVKEETKEVSIPYDTKQVDDATLTEGTKTVTTAGVNGVKKVTEKVTYQDGKEISRETASETVTTQPVTEITSVGTKKADAAATPTASGANTATAVPVTDTTTATSTATPTAAPTAETPAATPTAAPTADTSSSTADTQPDATPTADTTATEPEPSSTDNSATSGLSDYAASVDMSHGGSTGNATESTANTNMDLICAIVAHEGGTSYEGSLAVISCVMNRVDAGNWGGSDALSVLTAPGQFASYLDGYYTQYLGADIPEVRAAVTDCMDGGLRSHPYTSFRSYETDGSVNICGNWYF